MFDFVDLVFDFCVYVPSSCFVCNSNILYEWAFRVIVYHISNSSTLQALITRNFSKVMIGQYALAKSTNTDVETCTINRKGIGREGQVPDFGAGRGCHIVFPKSKTVSNIH